MVAGSSGVEEIAGGELRGGEGYSGEVVFGLRWSPIEVGLLGSSARTRGSYWWRWLGGEGSGCSVLHRSAAAAELAGVGEMAFPSQSTAREELGGKLEVA